MTQQTYHSTQAIEVEKQPPVRHPEIVVKLCHVSARVQIEVSLHNHEQWECDRVVRIESLFTIGGKKNTGV